MAASRIIRPPLSGRDRKHFARELHKAETAYEQEILAAAEAHVIADAARARAYALDCIAWTTRQFIGGDEAPSPTIASAIAGRHTLLEVRCRHCRHGETLDLALVIWPRDRAVHTLKRALHCGQCLRKEGLKRRPELVGLRSSGDDDHSTPARAAR
jgi:hypothetical protein